MKRNENDIYYAIGFKNGIMQAVSNGNYDFAKNTTQYYRSIGYNSKIYTVNQFEFINRLDNLERQDYLSLSELSILESDIITAYENGIISSNFEEELLNRIEKLDNRRLCNK
jgi:hypothetical protein